MMPKRIKRKCFIVTKAVTHRFKCLPVIEKYGWDPCFVCDNEKQVQQLLQLGVKKDAIVCRLKRKVGMTGVSEARDYVSQHLMKKGTWSIWLDDNVEQITGLPYRLSQTRLDFEDKSVDWRNEFTSVLSPKDLSKYIKETILRAETAKTIFCGFATENNYYFRRNKWQEFGYCRTQFALYKNDGSSWFPFDSMTLEDMYKSVDVVARYGKIVINRHVKPMKQPFEAGGIGSFAERQPHLVDNCTKIMELFPGLLKFSGKIGQYGAETEKYNLSFKLRSENTVNNWRKDNNYL